MRAALFVKTGTGVISDTPTWHSIRNLSAVVTNTVGKGSAVLQIVIAC